MKVIFANSLKGSNAFNEDAYYIGDNYALVLDGATSLEGEDVVQYIKYLLSQIKANYSIDISLKEILRKSIIEVSKIYENNAPSATIAMMRIIDNKIELLCLGDAVIIYKTKDGKVEEFKDDSRLFELDKNVYNEIIKISNDLMITPAEARNTEIIKRKLVENRNKMNTKDGYYILSNDSKALDFARSIFLDKNNISYLILASDGLTSYYNEMKIGTVSDFFDSMLNDGNEVFKKLREKENEDKDCFYIRFKISDDATGIVIEI